MAIITADMVNIIESSKLMFVASVRPDGKPNLSPKGSVRAFDDDHLMFADIASPQTIENVRSRPDVEINVVDFLSRRGYRFRGVAEVLDPGHPDFEWIASWLLGIHGDEVPCNHAVKIRITETAELLSPAYTVGHANEEEVVAAWRANYDLSGTAAH